MKHATFLLPLLLASFAGADDKDKPAEKNPVVVITTSKGEIRLELWPKAAPKTVANFLDLAEGRKEWTDPKSGEKVKKPFYDGLIFHRVIKDFMIQGGCPLGDGTGDAGYKFEDEINAKGLGLDKEKVMPKKDQPNPWLGIQDQAGWQQMVVDPVLKKFGIKSQEELNKRREEVQKYIEGLSLKDLYELQGYKYDESLAAEKPEKGVIAMANSGPNTQGSQFFINLVDTPWLTGKHTVFGKVVKGFEVVEEIGGVKTNSSGRPFDEVKIVSIRELKGEKKDGGDGKGGDGK